MKEWVAFTIAAFAVYRLARMLAVEEGPFDLFTKWRDWVYSKTGNGWVNDGVHCPLCIGFYLALIAGAILAYALQWNWLTVIPLWFAIAGASTFLYKLEK